MASNIPCSQNKIPISLYIHSTELHHFKEMTYLFLFFFKNCKWNLTEDSKLKGSDAAKETVFKFTADVSPLINAAMKDILEHHNVIFIYPFLS